MSPETDPVKAMKRIEEATQALRDLGVPRHRFVADVLGLFRPVVRTVFGARTGVQHRLAESSKA